MCSKCCGNCIYAWGEQWHNSVDGVKYEPTRMSSVNVSSI